MIAILREFSKNALQAYQCNNAINCITQIMMSSSSFIIS